MPLEKYKAKRQFNKTPEPTGKLHKTKHKLEFVVQKHHASHLHYDFRLEMGGVLKSWAVPKGPSLRPSDHRLAMMVEDHPWEYRKFEGVIPEGNYGAGEVIIWDKGTYEPRKAKYSTNPEKELLAELKAGHITFILHGQKLKGEFALVKSEDMEKNAWLLIKKGDQFASNEDITASGESVVSGKAIEELDEMSGLDDFPKTSIPRHVKPMLATLIEKPFSDKDWLYEIKWDGYRAIGSWDGEKPELYSRNGIDFSDRYNEITEALRSFKHKVVLDGEVVALDIDGKSHFEWLQNWLHQPEGNLRYVVFDLLWLDGHDIQDQPLIDRKELLKKIVPPSSSLMFSDHIMTKGKDFFKVAEKQKLEGIMAKKSDSAYRQGYRSKLWLKIKTHLRQEVVIGGYTEPKGSRQYIGSLLVGLYRNKQLVYAGHAGGLPPDQLKNLYIKLKKIEITDSPFADASKIKPNAPVHWVKPKLVCEVSFAEWTSDGRMRVPIFEGLRPDKNPLSVKQEVPKVVKRKSKLKKSSNAKLEFTHLDKVFFPETKITKGDLVEYYESLADIMLPYIKDRPHSLLRQPNGIKGESFFQKDVADMPPDWVQTESIYSESNQKNINYLVCNSADTLLYMVQLGCIEINPWNSRVGKLDNPDWIVMDLDPEDIGFDKVIKTAQMVHKVCDELKIPSYPKTSGKTGIHIYIPMQAKYDYDQAKQLAEILANLVNQRLPEFTSVLRLPKKRQKKVYVDFLQNRSGQTLAAPYSVRPTPQASVSTPLDWDEVKSGLDPQKFTIKNTQKRLTRVGDIWKPVLGKGIDIKKVLANKIK